MDSCRYKAITSIPALVGWYLYLLCWRAVFFWGIIFGWHCRVVSSHIFSWLIFNLSVCWLLKKKTFFVVNSPLWLRSLYLVKLIRNNCDVLLQEIAMCACVCVCGPCYGWPVDVRHRDHPWSDGYGDWANFSDTWAPKSVFFHPSDTLC